MNGSWYPWGQQPEAYVAAFRLVADAVHAGAPASAMVWAPNDGAGYPFTGGAFGAAAGSPDAAALDTDGDGTLGRTDDPYAPYWPGDDAVDWVGTSSYFWGAAYPWGENEIAPEGRFAAQLTGQPTGAHDDEVAVPDFYAIYAEGHDKPMAITETAALYDPSGSGPDEADVKSAWFTQVFSEATRTSFPRIGLVSWFEWRKEEPEVGTVIDWRLGADPALGRCAAGWRPRRLAAHRRRLSRGRSAPFRGKRDERGGRAQVLRVVGSPVGDRLLEQAGPRDADEQHGHHDRREDRPPAAHPGRDDPQPPPCVASPK